MSPLKQHWVNFLESEKVQKVRQYLPPLNFITVHYSYFIITCLITSVIFWGSSDPTKSITYTDALFLVVSAMTEAGLNTVNLSQMTTFQQFILWFLIVIGSSIFVSISTVLTRKRVFESRFKHVIKLQKEARRTHRRSMSMPRRRNSVSNRVDEVKPPAEVADKSDFQSRHSEPRDPTPGPSENGAAVTEAKPVEASINGNELTPNEAVDPMEEVGMNQDPDHIGFMRYAPSPAGSPKLGHSRVLSFVGVGAHPNSTGYRSFSPAASKGGIYNRGRKKDIEPAEEQLDHNEYASSFSKPSFAS
jgi:hypothetical protein